MSNTVGNKPYCNNNGYYDQKSELANTVRWILDCFYHVLHEIHWSYRLREKKVWGYYKDSKKKLPPS